METEYRIAAIAYNLTRLISILGKEELEKAIERALKGPNFHFLVAQAHISCCQYGTSNSYIL